MVTHSYTRLYIVIHSCTWLYMVIHLSCENVQNYTVLFMISNTIHIHRSYTRYISTSVNLVLGSSARLLH